MINQKTSKLLAALVVQSTPLEVDDFGTVFVRQLSVAENDVIAKMAKDKDSQPSDFGLQLLLRAVVDEDGNALFDDENLPELRASASSKVDKLVAGVLQINGYTKAAEAKN